MENILRIIEPHLHFYSHERKGSLQKKIKNGTVFETRHCVLFRMTKLFFFLNRITHRVSQKWRGGNQVHTPGVNRLL